MDLWEPIFDILVLCSILDSLLGQQLVERVYSVSYSVWTDYRLHLHT